MEINDHKRFFMTVKFMIYQIKFKLIYHKFNILCHLCLASFANNYFAVNI